MRGLYRSAEASFVDGEFAEPGIDEHGNLLTIGAASFREDPINVCGATSLTGGLGTVAASDTVVVAIDCSDFPVTFIDWSVEFDNGWSYQFARAEENLLAGHLTLADATAVDDTNILKMNAVSATAEDTAADVSYAAGKFYSGGADEIATAASLAKSWDGCECITISGMAVDETVTVNGVEYTAIAGVGAAADHTFDQSGTPAQEATALAARLNDAQHGCGVAAEAYGAEVSVPAGTVCVGNAHAVVSSYEGIPGVHASVDGTTARQINFSCTTATCLYYEAGTGMDANEAVFVNITLLAIKKQGAQVTSKTTTAAWGAEDLPQHYIDGAKWGYLVITNAEASTAILDVSGVRHR